MQLVEELSQELEELRSFRAEFMAKSKHDLPADIAQKHYKQLEAGVTRLKQVIMMSTVVRADSYPVYLTDATL